MPFLPPSATDKPVMRGLRLPNEDNMAMRSMVNFPDDGLKFDHPAIEQLPEFMGRIDLDCLHPCCRAFNGSICEFAGDRLLAYRSEGVNGMNNLRLLRLTSDFAVSADLPVQLPVEPGVHYEDPRLAVISGQLYLIFAHLKFGVPNICKQRLFVITAQGQLVKEIPMPFGLPSKPEKNWMPFELPSGDLGIVYTQKPHHVIDVLRASGHQTPGLTDFTLGKMLSGRTPPIRVFGASYLSFFGGHVRHSYRHARYFVGAQLFSAIPPFGILAATPEPLTWGSEASPTLFSSRPASGHPICIYPAGIIREGDNLIVSCGVNDSYLVLLRYSLSAIMRQMKAVNTAGRFVDLQPLTQAPA